MIYQYEAFQQWQYFIIFSVKCNKRLALIDSKLQVYVVVIIIETEPFCSLFSPLFKGKTILLKSMVKCPGAVIRVKI